MTPLPIRGFALALALASTAGLGQPAYAADSHYDPRQTFAKLTLPQPANEYRAGNGAPGPGYWQNRADYTIRARLLPEQKVLTASEVITYTNNSPETLDCLWLHLEQNFYKENSRGHLAAALPPKYAAKMRGKHTDGYQFASVAVEQNGRTRDADYLVSDTRMQIRLSTPLKPHSALRLHITYRYTIPGAWGGRTGWMESKNGDIFDIAQWYPRMAVFDDLRGWDTLPYLGSEFYLEYGDFDYSVTVPSDMLVAGAGELVNPDAVLTAKERAALARARTSDATVTIRSAAEVNDPSSRPRQNGTLTWHFRMKHTRDVSFAASRAFIWDAARIGLPANKSALAMSFYPVESAVPGGWGRSTQYIKDAIQNFSRRWYPYPWPAIINVAGSVSAMEYPGIVFDNYKDKDETLFLYTAHEAGHTWFPMIVGSNERRNAFMDEGFNTFIDVYESKDFNHGEFAPKHDPEYAPDTGNPIKDIQKILKDPDAPPIVTRADAIGFKYGHPISYFKTALGLVLLREQILGEKRFDFAFRKYIRDWAYKHPDPSDFFRAMDSAAGEDLSWFWRGWFFHNWNIDLAVKSVSYTDGDPAKGATVALTNLDRLVMPATVEIAFADGTKTRIGVPAEAWIQKTTLDLPVDSDKAIASVTIDPDQVIPDADRSNNVLRGPFATSASN